MIAQQRVIVFECAVVDVDLCADGLHEIAFWVVLQERRIVDFERSLVGIVQRVQNRPILGHIEVEVRVPDVELTVIDGIYHATQLAWVFQVIGVLINPLCKGVNHDAASLFALVQVECECVCDQNWTSCPDGRTIVRLIE